MDAKRDSTLAGARQAIADLQRQLAECTAERDAALAREAVVAAERDEGLEQQAATAEVLQIINSSPGDLAPVFAAILEKALHLCEANFGSVYARNGEHIERVASRGMPPEYLSAVPSVAGAGGALSPGNLLERMRGGENLISIADLAEPEVLRLTPRFEPLVRLTGARSFIAAALRKNEPLLGFIAIYRREIHPFTDKQIDLLKTFADQAVIAIENVRLFNETREALDQQTATSEVLGVINSSPGDLAPVFEAILARAHTICGAELGSLVTYDADRFRAVATYGYPPEYDALVRQPFGGEAGSAYGRLVDGERYIHIPDLVAVTPAGLRNPIRRAGIDLAGIRTVLLVPLRKEKAFLGYISAQRREVRPFSDKEIELIENFAVQAVVAIENARLINETREALEQQTATSEVLQVINSSPGELAPVFNAILEKAHTLCDAPLGALVLYDGSHLHPAASRGYSEEYAALGRQRFPKGFPETEVPAFSRLLAGENVLHVPDAAAGPMSTRIARAVVEVAGVRSMLFVPLRKDHTLLGYISAARQEVRPFSEKQIALLQNFAAQAVIAMENARLLGELRQRTEEVSELNRGLETRVAEQVEELGRVGRLKRFLAPQLAELIVSQGDEKILESHRREIVVVFCDLRGYTAFTETAEPEEVLDFLREYHGALGPLVSQFEGTLDQFSGDGIMVFFNDPVPIPDPAERAVKMAMAMRGAAAVLISSWRRLGRDLGFGAGIAQGYATLGQIGFSERSGYTAIGTVCNVAARLCAEAKDGQILISQRVAARLDDNVALEDIGAVPLKGLTQPVVAYNVAMVGSQPALRVIDGGPSSA